VLFKTDENLPPELSALLRQRGHDVLTVWDQQLRGKPDHDLAEACRQEDRVLITLDVGFADIRTYPPSQFPGIIVLRLEKQSRAHVLRVFRRVLGLLANELLKGKLWIADEQTVRIR
jgi:predicted nuclease of predicted toxin-antitoxin system